MAPEGPDSVADLTERWTGLCWLSAPCEVETELLTIHSPVCGPPQVCVLRWRGFENVANNQKYHVLCKVATTTTLEYKFVLL